jgi:RNA polymerase sigma-70 factor (ECF subfamily)
MTAVEAARSPETLRCARFAMTRWSLVMAARDGTPSQARTALADLCEAYWYPLYAYMRRRGYPADQAEDLTQEFFVRFVDKEFLLRDVDRSKGRFRNLLLAAFRHFLTARRRWFRARKRGGGRRILSIDAPDAEGRYALEPADSLTPERQYERDYALTLLKRVLDRLGQEYESKGREKLFESLKSCLVAEQDGVTFARIAEEMGTSPEAVRKEAQRFRGRYRAMLRTEVTRTVSGPGQVEDEIRALFAILGG